MLSTMHRVARIGIALGEYLAIVERSSGGKFENCLLSRYKLYTDVRCAHAVICCIHRPSIEILPMCDTAKRENYGNIKICVSAQRSKCFLHSSSWG
jgi:hypothetical protein